MRPILSSQSRHLRRLALAFAILALPGAAVAADPVEQFAQRLPQKPNIDDKVPVKPRPSLADFEVELFAQRLRQQPNFDDQEKVKLHQKLIVQSANELVRPGDVRRVLLLPEWHQLEGPPEGENPLGKTYQKVWADLAERLKASLLRSFQSDDSGRRLAAVIFLSNMATDERKNSQQQEQPDMPNGGAMVRFTPRLAGDLRKLLSQDKDPDVCAAAVRAVVEIEPGATTTIEAVKSLLEPTRKVAERRAAAEGLDHILLAIAALAQGEPAAPRPGIAPRRRPSPLDRMGSILVRAIGPGLKDEDATVRRHCLGSIQQAARQLQQSRAVNLPLAGAVNERMADVTSLLADRDLAVRLSAFQVLETVAATQRMLWRAMAEQLPPKEKDVRPREILPRDVLPVAEEPLLGGVLKALPALRKSLSDDEVRIRLASLYVLETLDFAAAPAVAEVVKALKDDKNGFVRWGAARVLNNMAPLESGKAVPALAEALTDTNTTVRLTAVAALQHYGPKAATAMKPLGKAIQDAEPRIRLGAIDALAAIGADARPEAGALLLAMKEDKMPEARAAAAKALGQMGRLDPEMLKALHNALRDPDAAVRQAASDLFLEDLPRFRGKPDKNTAE